MCVPGLKIGACRLPCISAISSSKHIPTPLTAGKSTKSGKSYISHYFTVFQVFQNVKNKKQGTLIIGKQRLADISRWTRKENEVCYKIVACQNAKE
jgi:hypothetical protein